MARSAGGGVSGGLGWKPEASEGIDGVLAELSMEAVGVATPVLPLACGGTVTGGGMVLPS